MVNYIQTFKGTDQLSNTRYTGTLNCAVDSIAPKQGGGRDHRSELLERQNRWNADAEGNIKWIYCYETPTLETRKMWEPGWRGPIRRNYFVEVVVKM